MMNDEGFKYTNKDGVEIEYIPESKSEIGIPYIIARGNIEITKSEPSKYYIKKNYKVKPDTRVP